MTHILSLSRVHGGVRRLAVFLCACVACALPAQSRADIVTDWNVMTLQLGGTQVQRTLAMVHLAMFDAVNSIERKYAPYCSLITAPSGTSAEAAAAAAAHGVLVRRFPAHQATLDAALTASVLSVPDGSAKTAGLALGDQVAAEIHALRANDNMLGPNPAYVPLTGVGAYQLTPPGFVAPTNVNASSWRPFILTDAAQFRPNGPLPLQHPRYAKDLDEVKRLGSIASTDRTADETIAARWYVEAATPAMNRIARNETLAAHLDLLSSARLFALLNLVMVDAQTSVFEAKYTFTFWRPVTAIREGDNDSNPDTSGDPSWTPLLETPPFPEYPSAHSVIDWSGIQVLESVFGQNHEFSTTSSSVPGVTRTFASFRAYATDASLARIYGGIHFRTAVEEGAKQGTQIGNWILERALLPVR